MWNDTSFSPENIYIIKTIPHHIICVTYRTPLLQMKNEM